MARTPQDQRIPDKLFFKIGEVAELTGTKPHVLRYWESEFQALRPAKGESGQRVYRKKDVEIVLSIKKLLYEENFTIAGAKKQMQKKRAAKSKSAGAVPEATPGPQFGSAEKERVDITRVRKELRDILDILNGSQA